MTRMKTAGGRGEPRLGDLELTLLHLLFLIFTITILQYRSYYPHFTHEEGSVCVYTYVDRWVDRWKEAL